MVDQITKTELMAMIEVQSKSAEQMEKIANSLHTIVEKQETISQHLSGCTACKETIKIMAKDVLMLKWIWTSLAGIVALGLAIVHILERIH